MPDVLENNARLHWRMTRMDATVRVSRIGRHCGGSGSNGPARRAIEEHRAKG